MQEAEWISAYLLGDLPEAGRNAIEDRMFADDEFFDRLEFVEDELIDAYVRGHLRPEQRDSFERHFLQSPNRRRRLETALDLEKHFGSAIKPAAGTSWSARIVEQIRAFTGTHRFAAACALAVGFAGLSVWLTTALLKEREAVAVQRQLAEQEIEQLRRLATQTASEPAKKADPELTHAPAATSGARPAIPAFILVPGVSRGSGETNVIHLKQAESVLLTLQSETSTPAGSYAVSIHNGRGTEVWKKDLRQQPGKGKPDSVTLSVPARVLLQGRYTLRLSGPDNREDTSDYGFEVVR